MTLCDNCNIDCFCPVNVIRYIQESVLETWFCGEECMVEFFKAVIEK